MKKLSTLFIAGFLLMGLALTAWSTVIPVFEPAVNNTWGAGQVIMTDNNGVIPCVGDWDNDGVKDLLVGTYYNGNVYYYHNTGTNANPVFPSRTMLQADGVNIAVTYG